MSLGKYYASLFKGHSPQVLPFVSAGMWCDCSDICCELQGANGHCIWEMYSLKQRVYLQYFIKACIMEKIFRPTVLCKRRTYRIVAKFWMTGGGLKENVKILCFNWRKIGWCWCLNRNKSRISLCWLAVQRKVSKSSAHGATKLLKFCPYKIRAI